MDETSRLAPQRVRVVLCLLAPNQRAVQITSDLAGFQTKTLPGR
ncbi:MAG: ATP-dependent helicase C-terminal domain-containing protein [Terracidiphilus sp.]|jgi:ATP-dependent helicase HrpB